MERRRLNAAQARAELRRGRDNAEGGSVVSADFAGIRVDVNEPLAGRGDLEEFVGLRGGFRHPPSDKHNEVSLFDPRAKFWIDRQTNLARIVRMVAVEKAGPSERARDRKREALGKASEIRCSLWRPSSAAEDGDGPLGRGQQRLEIPDLRGARPDWNSLDAGGVRDFRPLDQHVLGKRDDNWPGSSLHGDVKGALHDFGYLVGAFDLGRPFGCRAEEGPIVHFLEGAASAHRAFDLPDEEDEGRGIVFGDMHAMGGVGRARPPRDEADPRPAGQPTLRQRHHRRARLLPADRQRQRGVAHRVEGREVRTRPARNKCARRPA